MNCFESLLEAKTAKKVVLPPSIMPIVIVSGSDYEMGFQYGQQVAEYMEARKDEVWASALKKRSYDQIIYALKGVQYYVEAYTPELIDQMKGMANGATSVGYKMSYIDVFLMNASLPRLDYFNYPPGAEKEELPSKSCSVFSAWGSTTTDGSLIGCDSEDDTFTYQITLVAFPDEGNNWIGAMKAGEVGNHFAMNNKGLWLGNSGGGGSIRKVDSDYGINWKFMFQHLARFANNAVEAKDMTLKYQIDVAENFHYADVYGNNFVVEKTAALQSVRESGDFGEVDFLYSTNNYLNKEMLVTKKEGATFVKKHGGYEDYAAPRNMMIWDMLHNYHGKVDLKFAKMMWRFPGNAIPAPKGGWDAVVCRPTNEWVSVSKPDNGNEGIAYICAGPVGKVIHSSMHYDEIMPIAYPLIDGTHTFYKVTLASGPLEVVGDMENTAKANLGFAYEKFMLLNPTDPEFDLLNNLYKTAASEYYEGNYYYVKAKSSSGNEKTAYLGKAATTFTHSQARSKQIYEALVPPPVCPSDLGLKNFGDDWAEWETKVK